MQELRQVDDVAALLPVHDRTDIEAPVAELVDEAHAEVGRRVAELAQRRGTRAVIVQREADELRDRLADLDARAAEVAEARRRREERRQTGQVLDFAGVPRERAARDPRASVS
jgi:hypothetical protein